ncbi:hypothetical protein EFR00_00385 [Rhizobium sophoriradicis]|uniref:hypothetical protein n=1 Tax=Rhizobium sophoriradicis TaxID=1535245 RepID=UPI00098EDF15|nr:hypothetical protein [Rhizobium sophoriradicis]RSC20988.1 hypothetical protein EFR00_00385 [Rhizobium sophoriradicis]
MTEVVCILSGWKNERAALTYWDRVRQNSPVLADAAVNISDIGPKLLGRDDLPSQFSDSARRRVAIQYEQSTAFWRSKIAALASDTITEEAVGFLAEDGLDLGQHAFAFRRRMSEGEIHVVLPLLRLRIDGQTISTVVSGWAGKSVERFGGAKVRPMVATVTGWDIGAEVGSIGSLIGMVVISSNPAIGIPMMIGGQILSFVFQQIGRSQHTSPSIPTVQQIRAAVKGALEDQYVVELADESAALWHFIRRGYDEGWDDPSAAPDPTSYNDFVNWLTGALVPNRDGGATVTKANVKLALHLGDTDSDGAQTGLRHLPNFLAAASIEVLALQLMVLCAGAVSGFGESRDRDKNAVFRAALDRGQSRIDELIKTTNAAIKSANDALAERLAKISDVYAEPTFVYSSQPDGTSYWHWMIKDEGRFPPGLAEPFNCGQFTKTYGCCSDFKLEGTTRDQATEARRQKVDELSTAFKPIFGIPDLDKQNKIVASWQRAHDDISKALRALKSA